MRCGRRMTLRGATVPRSRSTGPSSTGGSPTPGSHRRSSTRWHRMCGVGRRKRSTRRPTRRRRASTRRPSCCGATPAQDIAKEATGVVDLLVVGRAATRTALSARSPGSVSDQLLLGASEPVLVVPRRRPLRLTGAPVVSPTRGRHRAGRGPGAATRTRMSTIVAPDRAYDHGIAVELRDAGEIVGERADPPEDVLEPPQVRARGAPVAGEQRERRELARHLADVALGQRGQPHRGIGEQLRGDAAGGAGDHRSEDRVASPCRSAARRRDRPSAGRGNPRAA